MEPVCGHVLICLVSRSGDKCVTYLWLIIIPSNIHSGECGSDYD